MREAEFKVTEPTGAWTLPGIPQSAAIARQYVATACDGMPRSVIEDAQLLTSELVANAVLHGDGDVGLRVNEEPGFVHIEVSDTGEGAPGVTPAVEADTGGRGLFLVDALSSQWGVTPPHPGSGVKSVWFELRQT